MVRLYANIEIYGPDGQIYKAKNTKLTRAIDELNVILPAKTDGNIHIAIEGIE